ncbi:MAG: transposase [Candidatus Polarisedimenticolia bacterium]
MNASSIGLRLEARETWEALAAFVREGAQRLVQHLLEEEAAERLAEQRAAPGEDSARPRGCRSGHGRPRRLRTFAGDLRIRRPRLRGMAIAFRSDVLPSFTRRFREAAAVQMEQYMAGLAEGDFDRALAGLLGTPPPLSARATGRMRRSWQSQHRAWRTCPLDDLDVSYLWVDRVEIRGGLPGEGLVVAVAVLTDGTARVVELESSSGMSPSALLKRLRQRGLRAEKLVVGGGRLAASPTRASR